LGLLRVPTAERNKVIHRTLGVIAAVLFGLFFGTGAIAFVKTLRVAVVRT